MFYICSFIERALAEGESQLGRRCGAASLKLNPVQMARSMQDALDDKGFVPHGVKDQVATGER